MQKQHVKDHYYHRAKREQYSARSVYKLAEIHKKYQIVSNRRRVLDLGAAPGSWTEYLASLLKKGASLTAIDERPLSDQAIQRLQKASIQFNFYKQSIFDELPISERFDLIVCDVAPWTGGVKWVDSSRAFDLIQRAGQIATAHLVGDGNFVVKLFHSDDSIQLAKNWAKSFKLGKLYKANATHRESKEIYFVGRGFEAQEIEFAQPAKSS